MKKYTQADFDAFEVIDGIKQCPSGDYSDIQIFGKCCSFGGGCAFEDKGEYIGDYPFMAFVGFGSRIGSSEYRISRCRWSSFSELGIDETFGLA